MAVHDVGVRRQGRHGDIDREWPQNASQDRIRLRERLLPRAQSPHGRRSTGRRRVVLIAKAAHVDVHDLRQFTREVLDVHAGTTVDVRRVFARKSEYFH